MPRIVAIVLMSIFVSGCATATAWFDGMGLQGSAVVCAGTLVLVGSGLALNEYLTARSSG